MVSIKSNISAQSIQVNINKASGDLEASVSRITSGDAIFKASDNVTGLAIGTKLEANVQVNKSALENTAQALIMTRIADKGIEGQIKIVTRINELAVKAASASLSENNRSFLNQEVQGLVETLDLIADTTEFNGIKLLDGSLYAPSKLESNVKLDAKYAAGSFTLNNTTGLADGEELYINGVTLTARADTAMATGTPGLNFDITANATDADQADAIFELINNVLNYQGTDAAMLTAKSKLSELDYSHTAASATISVTSKVAGTISNGTTALDPAFRIGTNNTTAAALQVNGLDAGNATTAADGVGLGEGSATAVAKDGALNAGTFGSTTAYSGTARTIAQGAVGDSILRALTPTVQATTGVDASKISNNPDFVGDIITGKDGVKATYQADNLVHLNLKVGNFNYEARNVVTNPTADTVVTFAAVEEGGGSFTIQLAANSGLSNINDPLEANNYASRLNDALKGVSFHQNRDVTSYNATGTVKAPSSGAVVGDLAGSTFKLINSNFSNVEVNSISVKAPVAGAANASITININGEDYVSGFDANGTASPLGTTISSGSYGFVSATNPKNMLVFNYTSSTNMELTSQDNATGLENAFIEAFGVNAGAASASFQVGSSSENSISIKIKSTRSDNIFRDANGNSQKIDLSSIKAAQESLTLITNGTDALIQGRAAMGSLQSSFSKVGDNLNVAIQNQDAARGSFLDTDLASESTQAALSKVRLQASITYLSQTNQLSQTYLELLR